MRKYEEVYDEGGEYLGDEYVNLAGLQSDTKKAILQLLYLDETVDIYNEELNKKSIKPDTQMNKDNELVDEVAEYVNDATCGSSGERVMFENDEAQELITLITSRKDGWVSVEDEMPEINQNIIYVELDKYRMDEIKWHVNLFGKYPDATVRAGYVINADNEGAGNYIETSPLLDRRFTRANGDKVTHWQPLPEPPQ